ncbi:MAG: hydrogenase maturation protease [Deltaproteobacteria bacterium]|nr:hydrogenase maturation protease [Deltaproteobacteria bacterium]NIS77533.1 hydrogenase maturation protease [Deltaproteobacteria bacterium]
MKDQIPEHFQKPVLVLGCGNRLFGDDGFGPAVIEYLTDNYVVPEHVATVDAGTGVRNILFDISLGEERVKRIIIVDAIDAGREPGEIFELDISEIPRKKIDDFSMHQLPTSNLLRELKELRSIDVRIISAQVEDIPDSVRPGLSETLLRSLPAACEKILEESK